MKKILVLLFIPIYISVQSQGIAFDKEKYNSMKEYNFDDLGFIDLPKSYSLREYAPIPETQVGNSCVGFSVAYSAMSIQFNKELGITSDGFKRFFSFDPYFIYSNISNNFFNSRCKKPTIMENALYVLKYYGCKRFFVAPFLDCKNKAKSESFPFARPFKIRSFYAIKDIEDKEGLITKLKKIVNNGRVPVVGIITDNSIYNVNEKGFWKPTKNDIHQFGHALSIIGYNDNKYGGCFELMNSWGADYGDNGFMWIKYEDLASITDEAYVIETYPIAESSCKVGNCYNGYGTRILDNIIGEGFFINGALNGFGIRAAKDKSVIYAGQFKNGYVHGAGLVHLEAENKIYFVTSKNGEFLKLEGVFPSETLNPNHSVQGGQMTSMLDDATSLLLIYETKGTRLCNNRY